MTNKKNFLIIHCSNGLLTTVLSDIDLSSIDGKFPVESIICDDKPLFEVMKVAYAIEQSGVRLQYRGVISTFNEIIQELNAPELKIIDRFWTINSMNGNEPFFIIGDLDVPTPLNKYVVMPRDDGRWQVERFNLNTGEYEPIEKAVFPSQDSAEDMAIRLNHDDKSDKNELK